MEKKGLPAAILVTERFVNLAQTVLRSRGMAAAPMVVLPRAEITEYTSQEQVWAIADQALEDAIAKLAPAAAKAKAMPA